MPLNQGNLAASLGNIIATYELTPKDKSLVVMPLFHVHGLMAGRGLPHLHCTVCNLPSCPLGVTRVCWSRPCAVFTTLGKLGLPTALAALHCPVLSYQIVIGCWSISVWLSLPHGSWD